MNYRIIVKKQDSVFAVDFRGVKEMKHPSFFENLGYNLKYYDNDFKFSSNSNDSKKYGLDYSSD